MDQNFIHDPRKQSGSDQADFLIGPLQVSQPRESISNSKKAEYFDELLRAFPDRPDSNRTVPLLLCGDLTQRASTRGTSAKNKAQPFS